jgi:hypothetical protein
MELVGVWVRVKGESKGGYEMSGERERIFLIAFCIAPASTGVGRDRYYGAGLLR